MKTAFIVLKSPQEQDPKHMVQAFSQKADAVVILFEDGIHHALVGCAGSKMSDYASEILVCEEDLEARGFSASQLKLGRAVGYPEIVDCIMERTERTVSI